MTCKDCIHSGLCYKENDYDNFPDRCGDFIPERPHCEEDMKGEEKWLDNFIKNYNKSKDFQITDIRDREKLLNDLRPHGEWICCPMCDRKTCNRRADDCDVKIWLEKHKKGSKEE